MQLGVLATSERGHALLRREGEIELDLSEGNGFIGEDPGRGLLYFTNGTFSPGTRSFESRDPRLWYGGRCVDGRVFGSRFVQLDDGPFRQTHRGIFDALSGEQVEVDFPVPAELGVRTGLMGASPEWLLVYSASKESRGYLVVDR